MRFGMVAAVVSFLLLLPATSVYAEDAQVVAVVSATPALMTVATSHGGRYTVTVDEGPRPEAEWFVTATSGDGPPVLLLSSQSDSESASGQAAGEVVVTLVH